VQGTTGGIPRVISAGGWSRRTALNPRKCFFARPGCRRRRSLVQASPGKVRTVIIKPDQQPIDPRVASNTAAFPNARTGGRVAAECAGRGRKVKRRYRCPPRARRLKLRPRAPKLAPTARARSGSCTGSCTGYGFANLAGSGRGGELFRPSPPPRSRKRTRRRHFRAMQAKVREPAERPPADYSPQGSGRERYLSTASKSDRLPPVMMRWALCESLKSAGRQLHDPKEIDPDPFAPRYRSLSGFDAISRSEAPWPLA